MNSIKMNFYMLKLIWKCSKAKVILHMFFALFQSVVDFITTIYFLKILISLLEKEQDFGKYVLYATIMLAIQLIKLFAHQWYYSYYSLILDEVVNEKLSAKVHKKALSIPLHYYEKTEYYNLQSRAVAAVNSRVTQVLNNMGHILGFVAISILALTYTAIESPFVLLFLIFPVIYVIFNHKNINTAYAINQDMTAPNRQDAYARNAFFSKASAKELRTTNLYGLLKNIFLSANRDIKAIYKKYVLKKSIYALYVKLFGSWVPIIAANAYTAYRFVFLDNLTIAEFSVIKTAINTFCNRLNRLSAFIVAGKEHSLYIKDLETFMNLPETENKGTDKLPPFEYIRCENLSFSYDGITPVIDGIDLTIKKGEKIAIVGENGAGKSTLIKLLLRLYDQSGGDICYNQESVQSYNMDTYRNAFGVAFQDYSIYGINALENVFMKKVNEGDKDLIYDALNYVGLGEMTEELFSKKDVPLTREFSNDGVVLSGGQCQKIAIARLFARDYQIAVLDEPSASLDPISEQVIIEKLLETTLDKTVILISHRLSIASQMDTVVLMEHGKIIEKGSHKELMERAGKYAKMFNLQAKAYQNENEGGMHNDKSNKSKFFYD